MSYINNTINWYSLSDAAIIQSLGIQLKKMRLAQNKTQQELADHCGLFRSTISEIENGRISSLLSLVQLLRGLQALETLDVFIQKDEISPLMVAEQQAKMRKRASHKRNTSGSTSSKSEW